MWGKLGKIGTHCILLHRGPRAQVVCWTCGDGLYHAAEKEMLKLLCGILTGGCFWLLELETWTFILEDRQSHENNVASIYTVLWLLLYKMLIYISESGADGL